MQYWYLFILIMGASLQADDAQMLSKQPICVIGEVAPCAFVNDTVHVVDGSFFLRMHHLDVPGHVPLDLVQYYNSKSSYSSWFGAGMTLNYSFWMQGVVDAKRSHSYYEALIAEAPGGSIISCLAKIDDTSSSTIDYDYYLDPKVIHESFTNCGSGHISARTNLKNCYIKEKEIEVSYNDYYKWICYLPDGTRRYYKKSEDKDAVVNVKEEKRPNFTSLEFDYHKRNFKLSPIKKIEAKGRSKMNWLTFNRNHKKNRAEVKSSNGKTARFYSFKKNGLYYIHTVESSDNPKEKFSYTDAGKYYCIDKVELPEGRFLEVEYDDTARVIAQKAPVGNDGEKRTIYTFDYQKGYTTVRDANNRKKIYRHKESRITAIEEYKKDALYRAKSYYWGAKKGLSWGKQPKGEEGNLLGYATLNHEKRGLLLCNYDYDEHGNILQETLCGNLSGNYPQPFLIDDRAKPQDQNAEEYKKYYKYSRDNLLIHQTEDFGPNIEYRYKPGTDLMWAKLVREGDTIVRREFYEYDDDGIVIEKITDDGDSDNKSWLSGVSVRLVTHIKPVCHKEGFGQGLAQDVWENYLDVETGTLILLKHTHYTYNKASKVVEEAVFDASDSYCYSITYEYDHKGRLHKKKDAIGNIFTYVYDANNNKTYEKQNGTDFHTIFEYDKANRLIQTTEYHYDDTEVSTSFEYDLLGNRIAATDRYGNTTSYSFDECNRPIEIARPLAGATIKKEYDLFDNVCAEVNENGDRTTIEYTARNQPSLIKYADGSQERFEYNKKGTLFKKWDKSGTRTMYHYDKFGRVTRTYVHDPDGKKLLETRNVYKGFHLMSSTDARGYTTYYSYDGAGRKVEELLETSKNCSKTSFEYDSLGRLSSIKKYYGEDYDQYNQTLFEYDFLDRKTLEKERDSNAKTVSFTYYQYDAQGMCTLKRSGFAEKDDAELKCRYNSKRELIEQRDEAGRITKISYNHDFINKNGQKTVKKTTTDGLDSSTEEYFDILGRLVALQKRNAKGDLVHSTDMRYSKTGQKIREIQHVFVDGKYDHDYAVSWKYDALNRPIRVVEMPNSENKKVTKYSYDIAGRVEEIIKPDGVILKHAYDALGRLQTLASSDNSVSYTYSYDRSNNPRKIVDNVSGLVTRRIYDAWNRITKEGIENVYSQKMRYDGLGRLKTFTIPDRSTIRYGYNDVDLIAVERYSKKNVLLYRHEYKTFDRKHRPTACSLIKDLGSLTLVWDKKGRNVETESAYYWHKITQFDAVGNLLSYTMKDPVGKQSFAHDYDDLYQLKKESGFKEHTYSYDSLQSRLSVDDIPYRVDSFNKVLDNVKRTFDYDKNGNLKEERVGDVATTYRYDALDRLVEVAVGTDITRYTYDSFNRRIKRNDDFFLYNGMREIGSMRDGSIKELRVLGPGMGAELGASVAIELEDKLYCPLHDFRGNIVCLVDTATGQPSQTYRYTAFGECEVTSHTAQPFNPWRFVSKRFDPETGFTYFARRYYAPTLGRYITPDPLGFSDGPNTYAYVHNNPLTKFDLYGLITIDEDHPGRVRTKNGNEVTHNTYYEKNTLP